MEAISDKALHIVIQNCDFISGLSEKIALIVKIFLKNVSIAMFTSRNFIMRSTMVFLPYSRPLSDLSTTSWRAGKVNFS